MTDKIYIFDTTLRDGEQSPGASMNLEEKVQIAEILDDMKVDIIEAGFPIASNGDFEAVLEISKNIKNSTIAGLARAKIADIERAWDAIKHAESSITRPKQKGGGLKGAGTFSIKGYGAYIIAGNTVMLCELDISTCEDLLRTMGEIE